jgi:hypothetical protein
VNDIRIFQVVHKKYDNLPKLQGYEPLFVGAAEKENAMPDCVRDDSGENISKKNNSYCELTGLYWIWKNCDAEYVGLVHYRRYFGVYKEIIGCQRRHIVLNKKNWYRIYTAEELEKQLENHDLLVKASVKDRRSVVDKVTSLVGKDICDYTRQAVEDLFPGYMDAFERYVNQSVHFNCNMFVGKKKIMDGYCEWLFTILEYVEKLYFENDGKVYENREIGYLGEMLFRVYLEKNKVRYRIVDTINIEETVYGHGDFRELIRDLYTVVRKKYGRCMNNAND